MRCKTEQRYALYRFYGASENLLYVGITNDPWRRWREHVQTQPWYSQVKHQAVTWYESEGKARAAEKRAIRSEWPRFNIQGAVRPPEARVSLRPETVGAACCIWLCVAMLPFTAFVFLATCITPTPRVAVWLHTLELPAVAGALSCIVPFSAYLLLTRASQVYRFGCWVNRNFGEPARPRGGETPPPPLPRGRRTRGSGTTTHEYPDTRMPAYAYTREGEQW